MWIESNANFILDIFKIFDYAEKIYKNENNKLLKKIEELIFDENDIKIKYITNEKRNP